MTQESLDERYLDWIYDQVAGVKKPRTRTYRKLFKQLYETIFVAIVSHDENRCEDGKALRYEFLATTEDEQGHPDWTRSPCTMLELLMVLARDLGFELDEDPRLWFWHLVEVLDLEQFNDRKYNEDSREVISSTLDRVIWRTYSSDGDGGLFPLQHPERDQRKVELWYQLNAFLLEQF